MALGLIDKLTNFIMPVEEAPATQEASPLAGQERSKANLRVHSPAALRVYVASPVSFDDVRYYADYLRSNVAVIVNFDNVDAATQDRISDFLHGILYITNGCSHRVSSSVQIFMPVHVDINKEMYAYSIPTYIRKNKEI